MPIWEVTYSRKQFRERETMRRRTMENPLVREDTNSPDQVVHAYETEPIIVIKRLGEPNSQEKVVRLKNNIKLV